MLWRVALCSTVVLVSLAWTPAAMAASGPPERPSAAAPHCAIGLAPNEHVAATPARCFPTLKEAVGFASAGAVVLGPTSTAPTETQVEQASTASTQPLLGIEYWNSYYGGSTLTLYGTSGSGCVNGVSYGFSSLSSTWNDEISSSKAYSSCDGHHYESSGYAGAVRSCLPNCTSFGVMNDETSSIRFR